MISTKKILVSQLVLVASLSLVFGTSPPSSSNRYVLELFKSFPYEAEKNLVFSPLGIKMCLLALAVTDANDHKQRDAIGDFVFDHYQAGKQDSIFVSEAHRVLTNFHQPPKMSSSLSNNRNVDKDDDYHYDYDQDETAVNNRGVKTDTALDNHNYLYTFLFMDKQANVSNEKVTKLLEDNFGLMPVRINFANKIAQEKDNFDKMFKEKLPTFRGNPPELPSSPELMNIIVFIRNWKKQFSKFGKYTFTAANKQKYQVDKMVATFDAEVGRSAKFQSVFISIPYLDDRYRMVIVMPESGGQSVQELLRQMAPKQFDLFLERLHQKDSMRKSIELVMPPFRIEQQLSLTEVLEQHLKGVQLNMNQISPLLTDLQAIQMSLIEVTEEGTFAQAMTRFMLKSMNWAQGKITLDRPFFYSVVGKARDSNKFEVLFAGYVNNPTV